MMSYILIWALVLLGPLWVAASVFILSLRRAILSRRGNRGLYAAMAAFAGLAALGMTGIVTPMDHLQPVAWVLALVTLPVWLALRALTRSTAQGPQMQPLAVFRSHRGLRRQAQ